MSNRPVLNNFSSELKKTIEDTIASTRYHTFKLAIGQEMTVPDNNGGFVRKVLYPHIYKLKTTDTIIDPGDGQPKDIAALDGFVGDKPKYLRKNISNPDEGTFVLDAQNPEDRKWLTFLYATNYNESNKHRQDVPAEVYIVDKVALARKRAETMSKKETAFALIRGWSDHQVIVFAAGMGWDVKGKTSANEVEILRTEAMIMADNDPATFLDLHENGGMELKHALIMAMGTGKVAYGFDTKQVTIEGNAVAQLDANLPVNKTYLDAWVDWVNTAPNGKEVLENIKKIAGTTAAGKTAAKGK